MVKTSCLCVHVKEWQQCFIVIEIQSVMEVKSISVQSVHMKENMITIQFKLSKSVKINVKNGLISLIRYQKLERVCLRR
jgi:hypothetical protein